MSSSSVFVSPYSKSTMLEAMVFNEVCEYLGFKDSVVSYQCVDKRHRDYAILKGIPFTQVKLRSESLNHFFEVIKKFPKVNSLILSGRNHPDVKTPHGTGKIERLAFENSFGRIPTETIMKIITAFEQVTGLSMYQVSGTNQPYFAPVVGESLTDEAKAKLSKATDLHLQRSDIHPQGIIEILQNSEHFTSVNLDSEQVNDGVFTALAFQPGLTSLKLSYTKGAADYAILAGCSKLEHFTLTAKITEEALIAIIQANPNLKTLDLSCCEHAVVTDRVLQAIASTCKGIESIRLDNHGVTDEGVLPLFQNCKSLVSIEGLRRNISPEVILELRNLKDFKEIKFTSAVLSDEFLGALVQLTNLTALRLRMCSVSSAEVLAGIKALTNLELLNLDGIKVLNDTVVTEVVNACKKLNTLRINWGSHVTVAAIDAIRSALAEKRTQLAHLSCAEAGRGIKEVSERLNRDFPHLDINPHTKWQ